MAATLWICTFSGACTMKLSSGVTKDGFRRHWGGIFLIGSAWRGDGTAGRLVDTEPVTGIAWVDLAIGGAKRGGREIRVGVSEHGVDAECLRIHGDSGDECLGPGRNCSEIVGAEGTGSTVVAVFATENQVAGRKKNAGVGLGIDVQPRAY